MRGSCFLLSVGRRGWALARERVAVLKGLHARSPPRPKAHMPAPQDCGTDRSGNTTVPCSRAEAAAHTICALVRVQNPPEKHTPAEQYSDEATPPRISSKLVEYGGHAKGASAALHERTQGGQEPGLWGAERLRAAGHSG